MMLPSAPFSIKVILSRAAASSKWAVPILCPHETIMSYIVISPNWQVFACEF
jgi:hypothetical protein